MAKKTLLSEGHIRKFMKLAAIAPLTENFLAEAEDEEGDMEMDAKEVEAEVEAPEGEEGDMEDMEDMDAEMGEEGEELEGEEAIKAALTQLIDAIKAAPEAEITVDEGYAMEEADEDGAMEEMMGDEDAMYEELNESVQVVDTQAIVKEVSRRVAQRLIKESKQEQLAEALAAKIAARLG